MKRVLLAAFAGSVGSACLGTPTPLAPGLHGSVGVPHRGVLTQAIELGPSGRGYVRYRPQGTYYWGTPELVGAIEEAARRVVDECGDGPPLVVGDLSARRGGRIERHQSHRTGRDADLLFYVVSPGGATLASPGFVAFGADGLAAVPSTRRFVRFDVERNWHLVKALLLSSRTPVQRLYASHELEALMIDYARARGEDADLVWHAEMVLAEPGDSAPHDDHFHLRVACTREQTIGGCDGGGPYWEWLPALPELEAMEAEVAAEELILARRPIAHRAEAPTPSLMAAR
jgi:penicillin-insensitive murein endopeptidase